MTKIFLPSFFDYKQGGADTGFEFLQDFWLAWTIRCADSIYQNEEFEIHQRAKHITYILLKGGKNNEDNYQYDFIVPSEFSLKSIETFRQFKRLDLIASMDVHEYGSKSHLLLNIENKWYTSTTDAQLKNANSKIKSFKNWTENTNVCNRLIYCDEYNKAIKSCTKICIENNFSWLSIEKLKKALYKVYPNKSGNALFDTYWY